MNMKTIKFSQEWMASATASFIMGVGFHGNAKVVCMSGNLLQFTAGEDETNLIMAHVARHYSH
jgi:hypothetical protein